MFSKTMILALQVGRPSSDFHGLAYLSLRIATSEQPNTLSTDSAAFDSSMSNWWGQQTVRSLPLRGCTISDLSCRRTCRAPLAEICLQQMNNKAMFTIAESTERTLKCSNALFPITYLSFDHIHSAKIHLPIDVVAET